MSSQLAPVVPRTVSSDGIGAFVLCVATAGVPAEMAARTAWMVTPVDGRDEQSRVTVSRSTELLYDGELGSTAAMEPALASWSMSSAVGRRYAAVHCASRSARGSSLTAAAPCRLSSLLGAGEASPAWSTPTSGRHGAKSKGATGSAGKGRTFGTGAATRSTSGRSCDEFVGCASGSSSCTAGAGRSAWTTSRATSSRSAMPRTTGLSCRAGLSGAGAASGAVGCGCGAACCAAVSVRRSFPAAATRACDRLSALRVGAAASAVADEARWFGATAEVAPSTTTSVAFLPSPSASRD
jgi:hypothetical protein